VVDVGDDGDVADFFLHVRAFPFGIFGAGAIWDRREKKSSPFGERRQIRLKGKR